MTAIATGGIVTITVTSTVTTMRSMTTMQISMITTIVMQGEMFWAFIGPMSHFAAKVAHVLALVTRVIRVTAGELLEDCVDLVLSEGVGVGGGVLSQVGSAKGANKGHPQLSNNCHGQGCRLVQSQVHSHPNSGFHPCSCPCTVPP